MRREFIPSAQSREAIRSRQHANQPLRYDSGRNREVRAELVQRDGNLCAVCGGPINMTLPPDHPWGPTIDLVIPRAQNGSTGMENLRLAHGDCNLRRDSIARHLTQFVTGEYLLEVASVAREHGWTCAKCATTCDPAAAKEHGDLPVIVRERLAHRRCGGEK